MPPIRTSDPVTFIEGACEAHRDGLLARIEMRRPEDLPFEEERLDAVLDAPDHEHPPVELERQIDVRGRLQAQGVISAVLPLRCAAGSKSAPFT